MTARPLVGYQYVVLRCVPRVDREEFINVGVVLYCQEDDFLAARAEIDPQRLAGLDPTLDIAAVRTALTAISAVCRGDADVGAPANASLGVRFGFVTAPRSTVVQPGPIHGGMTSDPAAEIEELIARFVSAD
jgi:Protein of unknown function (DUF3037)